MSSIDSAPLVKDDILEDREYTSVHSYLHVEGTPDEMKSSPVRRTLCLVILFDFLLCFIFWFLYVKSLSHTIADGFVMEIKNFTFNKSLFDCTCVSGGSFLYLEIIYGALQSSKPWWIAVSTSSTSIFILVKLVFYKPEHLPNLVSILGYVIIIFTMVISWIATLFLIYRVLPKEKAARNAFEYEQFLRQQSCSSIHSSERGGRINKGSQANASGNIIQYHMGVGSAVPSRLSPAMLSDDEENDQFYSPSQSRPPSPTQVRLRNVIHIANQLRESAWELVNDKTDWKYSLGDAVQGFITHKVHPGYKGKMFKIECLLNVVAEVLYKDIIYNVEQTHSWNPQVKKVTKIENISDNVDIVHNVTNDAMKGYVSSRDFVLLRVWGRLENSFVICNQSYVHPSCPVYPNIVRGEYVIGVVKLTADKKDPEQTKCVWIMNTDLKGRLMKSLVDRNMPAALLELIGYLRQHCYTINAI